MSQSTSNNISFLQPKDAWDRLSLQEKAAMMKTAVQNGITSLKDIRQKYNEFAEGGDLQSEDTWTMQDEADYNQWRESLPDNLRYTDDNLYDMRGAYKANMQPVLETDGYYHLGSRDPRTGRILKSPTHPTYLQAIDTDARLGYYPVVDDKGRTFTNTWEGNTLFDANVFRGGGYKPSDTIKNRIAKHEGKAMTGAKDPLSGKWGKNRSFAAEAKDFTDALPESIRQKVLENPDLADNLFSYSYNVGAGNFKKRVVPTLEKYYNGKATIKNVTDSMWASGDAKLRGLRNRRKEEREGVLNALAPTTPTSVPQDNIMFVNPYVLRQQNTTLLPQMVPVEDEYIRMQEVSAEQQRAENLQKAFEEKQRFNQLMDMLSIQSNPVEEYVPSSTLRNAPYVVRELGGPIVAMANQYAPGGWVSDAWNWPKNAPYVVMGLGGNLYDGTSQPTQKVRKASDYRYVQAGKDNSWSMIDNDEMTRVFQGLTVTPNRTKQRFIPERYNNSLEAAAQRDKFFQYRDEEGNLKGEPGLELVHPEFDAIALGPLIAEAGKYTVSTTRPLVEAAIERYPGLVQYPRYAMGKFKYGFDAELPTLYRKVKSLPKIENGKMVFSNPDNRFAFENGFGEESPIITNFTTDAPVRSHSAGDWDRGMTVAIPGKTLLGKRVMSTRPSDTFTFGDNISVPVDKVRGFTGRPKEISFLENNGIEAVTSPDAQIFFDSGVEDFATKVARYRNDLQKLRELKAAGKGPVLLKPREPIDNFSNYAKEIEDLAREAYKSPTLKDYQFMDYVFRPKYTSEVVPAVDDITMEAISQTPILGEWAGNTERLRYLGDFSRWRNVMYDPLTPAEANFRDMMNIGLKPEFKK